MKSRIFALILALCCLSLLLVACNDEVCVEHIDENNDLVCDTCGATIEVSTTEPETSAEETTEAPETNPPCDKHVDAEPADGRCDTCGANVVVVFLPSEPGETETRVEMEVVTAPADANPSDYIDLGEAKQPASSMETETKGIDYDFALNENIVWVEEEVTEIVTPEDALFEDETEIKVLGTRYDAIDLLTGKKIIPSLYVPAIDFDYPSISSNGFSGSYSTYTDGFATEDGYIFATNVGDAYNSTTSTYTMVFDGYALVSLYYEVNSESSNFDYLLITRNGQEEARVGGPSMSGKVDLTVYAGDTVNLTYTKDSSVSVDNEYCRVSIDVTSGYTSSDLSHGVTVDAYGYYFVVTKAIYSSVEQEVEAEGDFVEPTTETVYSVTVEKTAYTYNGVEIAKATWTAKYDTDLYDYVSESGTTFSDSWKLEAYDEYRSPEYAYVTYDGNIYLINKETGELIPGGSALTFIDRPAFDYANDAYGYVVDGYTLYVYDLSKWLECVYTYTVPGYYEDSDAWMLENGNLLLQTFLALPDDAVSYDIQNNYSKYDIVYILIDPAAKTATEVEFGYIIDECVTEYELFSDKAINVFVVYPIKQALVDTSAETILVVGNDLSILCQLPDLNYGYLNLFGNGYIRMYNDILECYEILDADFNFVTYVPGDATFYENFFTINDKFYTVAGGKIQALDTVLNANLKGEYVFEGYNELNLFIRETVEVPAENEGDAPTYTENHYVVTVDANGFKLTKIGKETDRAYEVFYNTLAFGGYATHVYVYAEDALVEGAIDYEASFINVYNQNGVKIGTTQNTEINLSNYQYYNCYEEDGVYKLTICYRDAEYNYQYLTYVIQ